MSYKEFDHLLSPVLIVDPTGKILYFNNICTIFFKKSPRKMDKIEKVQELIPTDSIDFKSRIESTLAQKIPDTTKEIIFNLDEYEQMALTLRLAPLDENVLINILDFSIEKRLHDKYKHQVQELKNTHEQILKADKLTALGEMISGISHEVSTPLTIVNDRLQQLSIALMKKDLSKAEIKLEEVNQEYQRVLRIISGMQTFARNQDDEYFITDLSQTIEEALSFFDKLKVPGNINIINEVKSNLWVMANPIKLQQAIINLIKNSIDAIRSNGKSEGQIKISIEHDEDSQVHSIKIQDTGPGISKDKREQVFEMFYTSKDIGEGTGLGLSITKKIIDAHNGFISINDCDLGCEFEIKLPIVEIGSFTLTNKYLRGESDAEQEKVLFLVDDSKKANAIYKKLKCKDLIHIYSNDSEVVENLAEFLMLDKVIKLFPCDLNVEEAKNFDFSQFSFDVQLEKLEVLF